MPKGRPYNQNLKQGFKKQIKFRYGTAKILQTVLCQRRHIQRSTSKENKNEDIQRTSGQNSDIVLTENYRHLLFCHESRRLMVRLKHKSSKSFRGPGIL